MMPKIELPQLGDNWTTNDIVKWINSRPESSGELLEAVKAAISETKHKLDATKAKIDRLRQDENSLEECAQSCMELRERLRLVVELQTKEQQFTNKFDEIAVYDQADRRATELANIVRARIAWKEGVKAIESLDDGEPAPENVVFSLQEAYTTFSKHVAVPDKGEYLEKIKDIFLSWYSTRVVLALQSDSPTESLIDIKSKYDTLQRTKDFNAVLEHYVKDQSRLELNEEVNSLPDLFVDIQRAVLANYTRLREGKRWAEKVLDSPSEFIANALSTSILTTQWNEVIKLCDLAINKTFEEDSSGALTLRMILALKQLLVDISAQNDEDKPITECIIKIGNRIMAHVAAQYSKLATSFLNTYANISLGMGAVSNSLEELSKGLSQLIKESDYLLKIALETFGPLAIVYIAPAFRSMYENLVSLLSKFYKTTVEKLALKDNDILRLISISGQMISWVENDRKQLKDMLEAYKAVQKDPSSLETFMCELTGTDETENFEKRISEKAEGDMGIAKTRSELRKLNKRFVARAVERLSYPFVSSMENALRNIRSEQVEKGDQASASAESMRVPSFGSNPNEFITSAGVALLSLAHQLSAYSHDSNMSYALANASKTDSIDDVTSWWVEKCAAAVQDCFIDGVGEIKMLPSNLARQFSVDYVYLADVFEDLGTPRLQEFDEMRQTFIDLGYINEKSS